MQASHSPWKLSSVSWSLLQPQPRRQIIGAQKHIGLVVGMNFKTDQMLLLYFTHCVLLVK